MTYKEFADYILNKMTTQQQEADLTFYNEDADEFHEVELNFTRNNEDRLDVNHPFLSILF